MCSLFPPKDFYDVMMSREQSTKQTILTMPAPMGHASTECIHDIAISQYVLEGLWYNMGHASS